MLSSSPFSFGYHRGLFSVNVPLITLYDAALANRYVSAGSGLLLGLLYAGTVC